MSGVVFIEIPNFLRLGQVDGLHWKCFFTGVVSGSIAHEACKNYRKTGLMLLCGYAGKQDVANVYGNPYKTQFKKWIHESSIVARRWKALTKSILCMILLKELVIQRCGVFNNGLYVGCVTSRQCFASVISFAPELNSSIRCHSNC